MRTTGENSIPRLRDGARKLQLPQRGGDRQAGRPDGWEEPADEPDGERDPAAGDERGRRPLEGEGDLAEALPVQRRGADAVEAEIGDGRAEGGADQRDDQRL